MLLHHIHLNTGLRDFRPSQLDLSQTLQQAHLHNNLENHLQKHDLKQQVMTTEQHVLKGKMPC